MEEKEEEMASTSGHKRNGSSSSMFTHKRTESGGGFIGHKRSESGHKRAESISLPFLPVPLIFFSFFYVSSLSNFSSLSPSRSPSFSSTFPSKIFPFLEYMCNVVCSDFGATQD